MKFNGITDTGEQGTENREQLEGNGEQIEENENKKLKIESREQVEGNSDKDKTTSSLKSSAITVKSPDKTSIIKKRKPDISTDDD